MTKLNEIYKCNVCGNIVEMTHAGAGELVCCGQPMELIKEQSEGEYAEKHAPVRESLDNDKVKIKIGQVEHPMEDDHYIEWIEIITLTEVKRHYLKPGEKPEAEFCCLGDNFTARMYCNIHGLWKS